MQLNYNSDELPNTPQDYAQTPPELAPLVSEIEAQLRLRIAELEGRMAQLEQQEAHRQTLLLLVDAARYQPADTPARWGTRVLEALAEHLEVTQAALYATHLMGEPVLECWATFAYSAADCPAQVPFGRGLVGQAAQSQTALVFSDNDAAFRSRVSSGIATLPMRSLVVLPLVYNNRVEGVLELAAAATYTPDVLELIYQYGEQLVAALLSIRSQELIRNLNPELMTQGDTKPTGNQPAADDFDPQAVEFEQITAQVAAQLAAEQTTGLAHNFVMDAETAANIYETMLNAVEDVVMMVDTQLQVVYMNRQIETQAITNGVANPYIGMPLGDLLLPEQRDELIGYTLRALSGEVFSQRVQYKAPGGKVLEYDMDYFPVYDLKNRLLGAACVGRDTQRAQVSDESRKKTKSFRSSSPNMN